MPGESIRIAHTICFQVQGVKGWQSIIPVSRSEVVSPLRDAVSLIDGDQRETGGREDAVETGHPALGELRSHVHDPVSRDT